MSLYSLLDWLKTAAGNFTRYGVAANNGTKDRVWFVTERQARDWALRAELRNYVVFGYDVRERNLPSVQHLSVRP